MRGILVYPHSLHSGNRFNPAYAGNITSPISFISPFQVQPRVCGEYFRNLFRLVVFLGSTPRMRGISISTSATVRADRFNPAYAGNIPWNYTDSRYDMVQPRVCGEYLASTLQSRKQEGSTPRMRGISNIFFTSPISFRFNPAYAGNITRKTLLSFAN